MKTLNYEVTLTLKDAATFKDIGGNVVATVGARDILVKEVTPTPTQPSMYVGVITAEIDDSRPLKEVGQQMSPTIKYVNDLRNKGYNVQMKGAK